MELSGISPKQATQSSDYQATSRVASAQIAVTQKSESVREPVLIAQAQQIDLKIADERRFNSIKKTVEREINANAFVVGDSRFTIFKDAKSGQYITRFTSLRDGAVTYVPEPQILKLSGASDSYYEIDA